MTETTIDETEVANTDQTAGTATAVPETPDVPDLGGSVPEPAAPAGGFADEQQLGMLMDIDMKLTVELGRTNMRIREIMELSPGSIVELGKSPAEPVDILVNGVVTARGEVVVVDEHFAVRVTRLIDRDDRGQLR